MAHRVVHFEIHAEDPATAARWYADVFGWKTQPFGPDYVLLMTGEGPGIDGGVMRRMGPRAAEGAPLNAFVCTIAVDDIDGHWTRALDAGAGAALPKMAIPGVGWTAYVHDPFGNIVGLHQEDRSAA